MQLRRMDRLTIRASFYDIDGIGRLRMPCDAASILSYLYIKADQPAADDVHSRRCKTLLIVARQTGTTGCQRNG